MKKLFLDIRKHPISYIVGILVAFAIGFSMFAIFYFWLSAFTIVGAINGTGVSGAVLIAVFGLAFVARQGAFDTLSYGFTQMFASMFNKEANRYNDMVEYKEQKNVSRAQSSMYYFTFLLVGVLHFVAFAILEVIFHTLY